ncbi:MAG: amino acid ABC transporter substrate-binding protein [Actinobacteria bacterium]|nr:amino acid ABC transporter substrate-binding protein [Actinomycetota bacterium]
MRRPLIVTLLAFAVVAAACDGGGDGVVAEGCDPPPLKTEGTLTVAAEFPYYEPFLIGEQADPTGSEGEMIDAIADQMGVENVEWVNIAFDQLYAPGDKTWDVGVSEITITEEREDSVDFSAPYFEANQGILVRADSEFAGATSVADLADAKFGAEAGTTGLDYIEANLELSEAVSQFDTTDAAAAALKAGTIDVQIIDVPIAVGIRDGSEDVALEVIGQFITNEEYGLAMEDGSPLKPCIDAAIQALKDDGSLDELQDQYFPGSVDLPVFEP